MILALLLIVPLTALALVMGMARLEESLLTAPVADEAAPAPAVGTAPVGPRATG